MLSNAKSPVLALALVTVFGGCTMSTASQQGQSNAVDPVNASYSVTLDSGIVMTPQEATDAGCDTSKEICATPIKVKNTLDLSTMPNGDLAFSVFTNAFNGHSCSLDGIARKAESPNTWEFVQYNDGAACKLNIRVENGAVTLQQDEGSNCDAYCGSRAYLGGTFPFSSIK